MKRITKELICLGVYLILMPLLGYISYKIYLNFAINSGKFAELLIVSIIVIVNILACYGLNAVIKKVPKVYFIANGIALNVSLIFITCYYIMYKGTMCETSTFECTRMLEVTTNLKYFMGYSIIFTIIYIMMFNIESKMRKPVDFSPKKK